MSDVTNKRVHIYIDQASAEDALGKLQTKADGFSGKIQKCRDEQTKLLAEIKKSEAAGKDVSNLQSKYDTLGTRINAYNKSLNDTATAQAKLKQQIDSGIAPSFNQLSRYVNNLHNELKNLSKDAPEYAAKFQEFKKASTQLLQLKDSMNVVTQAQKQLVNGSTGLTKVGVFFASFAANMASGFINNVGSYITGIAKMRMEFEKSVANLSAITGATGADLKFLENAAIELSVNGVNSAKDFVEAMKLIGSAKPELLSQKELLVEVTKASKLLAEASGMDLPDAAKRLTDALNQYGAGAGDATKYVDVLAAAAKYGAAEVGDVTDALLQFGTQAASSNVSIYESSAAIELLAEKGIKGAEAGTKLRNVFLALNAVDGLDKKALDSLQKAGVNTEILKDKSLSLQTRLEELSKVSGNAASLVAVFGKENFNAAQIVLQNIPRYAELEKQVRETGVASQQAATNTATWSSSWENLKNVFDAQFLQGENSFFVSLNNQLANGIAGMKDFIKTIGFAMAGLSGLNQQQQEAEARMKGAKRADEQAVKGLITSVGTKKVTETTAAGQVIKNADGTDRVRVVDATAAEKYDAIVRMMKFDEEQLQDAMSKSDVKRQAMYKQSISYSKAALDILAKEKTAEDAAAKAKKDRDEADKAMAKKNADEKNNKVFVDKLKDEADAADKAKKELERLRLEMTKLEKQLSLNALSQYEQGLAKINDEYDKLFVEISRNAFSTYKDIQRLEADRQKAIEQYNDKILQDVDDFINKRNKKEQEGAKTRYEIEIDEINKVFDEKVRLYEGQTEILKKLEAERKKEIADVVVQKKGMDIVDNFKPLSDPPAKQADSTKDANGEKILTDKEKDFLKGVQQWTEYANQVIDIIGKINAAADKREQAALAKEISYNNKRKEAVQKLAASKILTEVEARRQMNEIDQESANKKEELDRKQFERNKKLQLVQTITNALSAGIQLWVKPGFPANIPLLAILAGQTAAAISTISAQKYAIGGRLNGPSHSNGGMPVINPNTGQKEAEVEGGEYILSRSTVANNRPLADALLNASMYGGGRSVAPVWNSKPYQPINFSGVTQSIQKTRFADGGVFGGANGFNQSTDMSVFAKALEQNQSVMMDLMQTNFALKQQLQKPIQAISNITLRQIDDAYTRKSNILKEATP